MLICLPTLLYISTLPYLILSFVTYSLLLRGFVYDPYIGADKNMKTPRNAVVIVRNEVAQV